MKTVILLLAYVALLNFASGALEHRYQPGINRELTSIHPFYIPPESVIVIQKVRNGMRIPGSIVYGTLHRVPVEYFPQDDNEPFGHVFVIINEHNIFYARLADGRAHIRNNNNNNNNRTHNGNNGNNNNTNSANNEVPEYTCYIRRPPHRGLTATLLSVNEEGQMHDIPPHVHYMASDDIHVVGDLTHLSVDDLAPLHGQRSRAP